MRWPMKNLGEIVTFRGGGTPRKDNPSYWSDEIPWATVKDFKGVRLSETQDCISANGLESSSANLIPAGHVIIPTRMALGKAAINSIDLAINQDLKALIPQIPLDASYLLHSMLGLADVIERNGSGATVKGITQAKLAQLQIPLPPLPEQKRIAAILDAADALRAKRRESITQLDTLLQSTFLDMFGDPVTNPKGWEVCRVGEVVHSAKDGPHVSPDYAESGIPFLSTRHIKPGEVIWEDLKYIDQNEANRQWKKCKPETGDILYTKGGTTGLAARVTTAEPFAIWVHIALLKPITEKVHPAWIEAMLNSDYCYTQSQRYTHGIANRDLGLKRMVKIKMYLPPLTLQHQFATIVESVEKQKSRLRAHLSELDTLFASLQSRAFNGEL